VTSLGSASTTVLSVPVWLWCPSMGGRLLRLSCEPPLSRSADWLRGVKGRLPIGQSTRRIGASGPEASITRLGCGLSLKLQKTRSINVFSFLKQLHNRSYKVHHAGFSRLRSFHEEIPISSKSNIYQTYLLYKILHYSMSIDFFPSDVNFSLYPYEVFSSFFFNPHEL
jgi:hypothetical protein